MAWFPGAIRDPGRNAGYRRGRCIMQLAVEHFTVGRDSRALIRDQGLAAFLFPKHGQPFQFCEADAITAHACEWNRLGPGLEFERMSWDEPLTGDQITWGGRVHRWLHDTYGIPLVHHAGARLPIGSPYRGFVNHGSLVHRACDQHTDGITAGEWAAMVAAAGPTQTPSPTPSPRRKHRMEILTAKTGFARPRHVLKVDFGDRCGTTEIDDRQVLALAQQQVPRFEGDKAQVNQILERAGQPTL